MSPMAHWYLTSASCLILSPSLFPLLNVAVPTDWLQLQQEVEAMFWFFFRLNQVTYKLVLGEFRNTMSLLVVCICLFLCLFFVFEFFCFLEKILADHCATCDVGSQADTTWGRTDSERGTSSFKKEKKRKRKGGGGDLGFLRKRVKVRRLPALTHVQDVERDDIRGGPSQLVGRLHPDLVGREEVQVPGDAARVGLSVSVVLALLLLAVPPGRAENGGVGGQCMSHTLCL